MLIPEDEQENIIHVYWVLLRELESRIGKNDVLTKISVEGAYDLLSRLKIIGPRPSGEEHIADSIKENIARNLKSPPLTQEDTDSMIRGSVHILAMPEGFGDYSAEQAKIQTEKLYKDSLEEKQHGISKEELDKKHKEFIKVLNKGTTVEPKKHSRFTEWLIKILS